MGKVGDTIRDHIGIILLAVIFVAFIVFIEVQRTSPGNVAIGVINTFVESTAIPVNNWLATFHMWLPPMVCYILGIVTLVVVPRLWGKRSSVKSTVQKTTAKIKPQIPITKLDNPGTEVKEAITTTSSEIKSTSEQAKEELEKIKSSV